MIDIILEIVLKRLASLIRDEVISFWGVGELTRKLTGNLTSIQAVLRDAEEKQVTSNAIKDWLQKLSDAAYVLDDVLDECSTLSKSLHHRPWINSFHPRNIWIRRNLGKKLEAIAKRIDLIAEERIKFALHVAGGDVAEYVHESRLTTSVIDEPIVYGRDRDIEVIVDFLLNHAVDNEELCVYPIVGVGGNGKTTLAQLVFNDERVDTHFDLKIWVCVSNDFSMIKVLEYIIESTLGKYPDPSSLGSMEKRVLGILQNKRYLLVLDDVWSEDHDIWNTFKHFLQRGSGTKGASILVTTRLATVASIMGTLPAHHLLGLSDADIWSLFKQYAFGTNTQERDELVAIGKEIVRKCVGSPLVAKVMGGLLRFKSEEHQWLAVKESKFWNSLEDNPIMSALMLSYFNLKLSLRPCFTFCAVFPKDFVMVKEQLIHLWLANGFISSRGNSEVEYVGDEVWNELYARSFFQEVKTDKKGNVTFKMHDLLHDVARLIIGEECVAFEGGSLTDLSRRVHHISFSCNRFKSNTIGPLKKVESLRTFLELGAARYWSGSLPSNTPLRALHTNSPRLSALKSLTHLRYLELFKSTVDALPRSICRLQNLQILKLDRCHKLSSLPKKLTQLQDLRHLVIKDCPSLVSMPSKIGNLTGLKTLSIFIVGSKAGSGLAELHHLQLGGKLQIRGLENVESEWDAKEANLISKKDLNGLYLSWSSQTNSQGNDTNAVQVLEALEPHTGLKSFGLKDYAGMHFPCWMRNNSFLEGLVDVILYNCKNCQWLPSLGKLPYLSTLYVCGMRDLKYIDDALYESTTERAFVSLKKLTLRGLPNLEKILQAEGVEMLPQLSYLKISGVPKLALSSLPSLETLDASGSNDELLNFFSDDHCNEKVDLFPKEIVCNMHNLKTLSISNFGNLEVLPDALHSLSDLEELSISFCDALESFSMHVLQGLRSLRTLIILVCPKLKSLSEGLGDLACLEKLEICKCKQLVLPNNMNRLTALRQVEIHGNCENCDGLEGIPSLQMLTLWDFPYWPEFLGSMTSLQGLEIGHCPELRSYPDSFKNLINLQLLHIHGCPALQKQMKMPGEKGPMIPKSSKLVFNEEETLMENTFSKGKKEMKEINDHTDVFLSLNRTSEEEFNRVVDTF